MSENRVLRRMFELKRVKEAGSLRRLHNKELYKLYASPNITVIKSSRRIWAGHVTNTREIRNK
jgi:hypothetical protein